LSTDKVSTTVPTVPSPAVAPNTTREFDPFKHLNQQQQQQPASPDSNRSNSNNLANNEHPTAPAGK
jgi:hypothetical protein